VSHKRSWSTFAVLAVAVSALVVGSVGTATAGGLTKGAVKKIATKVVKKQASHLTVASAGNANTVGGLAPSALQERRTVFTTSVVNPVSNVVRVIPLPGPGSYEVSYSAFLDAGSMTSECWIQRTTSADVVIQYYADDASSGAANRNAHSAVDVVQVGAGEKLAFGCGSASGTFTTQATAPIQIVVTQLDSVTNTQLP
jgi:hypothetical protein